MSSIANTGLKSPHSWTDQMQKRGEGLVEAPKEELNPESVISQDVNQTKTTEESKILMPSDSVYISEEAKEKQQTLTGKNEEGEGQSRVDLNKSATAEKSQKSEESDSPSEQVVKRIMEQIKQVKEKIEDAKARLQEAGGSAPAQPESSDEAAPDGESENASAAKAAASGELENSMLGLSAMTEAEAIQTELKMLYSELQILYNELMKAQKGGSSGFTAVGGGGDNGGRGGLGERIEVKA